MLIKICKTETEKKNQEFHCKFCDYSCNKLFLYKQHIKTKKHKKNECSQNAQKNMQDHLCCKCGKIYKHVQSFKRHQKICPIFAKSQNVALAEKSTPQDDSEKKELRNMITTLITQNQAMLLENKEMRELVHDMIPKIGNNNTTIHNKFNLQVFLNEQCKDAINLTDFVESLQLEMGDLATTRQVGFISGLAKIFVRGLKELDLHRRPIHCSDLKREVLYVKDNDTWEKDSDDNKRVKRAISTIAKRQISKIKEWEKENPDWNKSEEGTQRYIEMVRSVTGPETEEGAENKIIKTIAKEVTISKDSLILKSDTSMNE